MTYKIFFEKTAVLELKKIPEPFRFQISEKIKNLANNLQTSPIKKLQGNYNLYRLRVGKYRVIFNKDDDKIVITIVRIGHRKNIYKKNF